MGEKLFAELDAKINRMGEALEKGGDYHAEQLGKDIGELVWQVGTVASGAVGAVKGGALLAKAGIKVGKKTGGWLYDSGKNWGKVPLITKGTTLSQEIIKLAEANITNSGKTVLGSYPGYINKATSKGASYFDIGAKAWDSLNDMERWAANSHFLDRIAQAGDQVYLSVPKESIQRGTWLSKEVEYLTTQKKYIWVNQWSLKKVL